MKKNTYTQLRFSTDLSVETVTDGGRYPDWAGKPVLQYLNELFSHYDGGEKNALAAQGYLQKGEFSSPLSLSVGEGTASLSARLSEDGQSVICDVTLPRQGAVKAKKERARFVAFNSTSNTRLFRDQLKRINVICTSAVVIISVLLITFCSLFAAGIGTTIDGYVEAEAKSVMSNFTEHVAEDVSGNLESWYSQLNMAGELFIETEFSEGAERNSEVDAALLSLASTVKFEKIGLVLSDGGGTFYLADEERYSEADCYAAVAAGDNYIGKISGNDGYDYILFGVPYEGDNSTGRLAGIAAIMRVDTFAEFISTSVFQEQSYVLLVNGDGSLIASGRQGTKSFGSDFLLDLNAMGVSYDVLATVESDLASGASNIHTVSYLGESYFLYYDTVANALADTLPASVSSWRVVMFVAVEAISQDIVNSFNSLRNVIISIVSVACVGIIAFVICAGLQLNRNLRVMYVDTVTNSINQRRFNIDAAKLINDNGHKYALVCLNVRHFKLINESEGRDKADAILAEILRAAESFLGEGELIARGYADRYLMLVRYDGEQLEQKVERIFDGLSQTKFNGGALSLKFVMGVYRFPEDGEVKISTAADCARLARTLGQQTMAQRSITYFNDDMITREKEEDETEQRAEIALKRGDFVVYYQAKCNIQKDEWCGAEALVRWKDPERGLIPPGKFIPLFERNGFIVELDKYVFEHVCMDIRAALDGGKPVVPVSVNLSRGHFADENFFEEYEQIMARHNVPHKYIEFEITESLVMDSETTLKHIIARIHEIGCRCSIDDFGSGYSSFNMLSEYDFDIIKLDGKFFLSDSGFGADSRKIVSSLIRLFHDLDKEVVAEGVENKETVDILRKNGCDTVQGFYYARPVPYDEYEEKLSKKPLE